MMYKDKREINHRDIDTQIENLSELAELLENNTKKL